MEPRDPLPPPPAVPQPFPIATTDTGAAAPSKLTGRKLLFIILGLLGGCGLLVFGALAVLAVLGVKLFDAVR